MIVALLLTVILECLALLLLRERDKLFYLYWTAVTALTNTLVNVILLTHFSEATTEYWIAVAILEMLVFLCELLFCFVYTLDIKKSALYSAVCNILSFSFGLIFQIIINL